MALMVTGRPKLSKIAWWTGSRDPSDLDSETSSYGGGSDKIKVVLHMSTAALRMHLASKMF